MSLCKIKNIECFYAGVEPSVSVNIKAYCENCIETYGLTEVQKLSIEDIQRRLDNVELELAELIDTFSKILAERTPIKEFEEYKQTRPNYPATGDQ